MTTKRLPPELLRRRAPNRGTEVPSPIVVLTLHRLLLAQQRVDEVLQDLEFLIHCLPTGDMRSRLTDANIAVTEVQVGLTTVVVS